MGLVLALSIGSFGQNCPAFGTCATTATTSVSGTALQLSSNGGLVPGFNFSFSNGTGTVTTQGCIKQTCDTLDSYTGGTTNRTVDEFSVKAPTAPYDYFVITATFASGTFSVREVNNSTAKGFSSSGTPGSGNVTGPGSAAVNALALYSSTTGKAIGQSVGSGYSTTFPSSGTGFQQMAKAPQNSFVADNGNWGYGIDTAVTPMYRDFVMAYIQEGLPGLTPSDYDFVYAQYNAQYTTLSSPLTVGATTIHLTSALTIGTVMGGHQYILIGGVSTSDQQMCVYVSGSGTTTFVVSNCYSVSGGTVSGSAFANPSLENVTILNDLAHQPTLGIGGDLGNPNMRLSIFGDSINQPGMGGISILGAGGTLGAANPLEARSGVGFTSQLRWWVNQNYQMAVSANAVNRTGSDGITNTDTTFCSATAAFTPDDLGNFIVATNVPTGDYVITWTSATCVVLKVATTGTASSLTWTLYEPYAKIMSAGSFPAFQCHPGAGAGACVATDLVTCFGAGCGALPTHTMEVRASGSNNATSSLQTASQGNIQQLCNGSSAKCTIATTNSSPLGLGTANCADATCAMQIQTDNRTTFLKESKSTGVPFASLDTSPAAGEYVYCSDCQVTTAATCSSATPASCVCKATGNGAFARYMNYQGGGANWYCQ